MESLGKDDLELISQKLTFSHDYRRFRFICKSWRSAAPKRPQLPWFIARNQTDFNTRTSFFKFYEFSFETNKFLQIPELSELSLSSSSILIDHENDCIGYSHGWMALFNRSTVSISLFNPLTNSFIDLPVLQNWSANAFGWDTHISSINLYLTSDPGELSSDCFALVCNIVSQRIMYCKVGCTDWIEMPHPEFKKYSHSIHICCYRGKTFIASGGDVFVCDSGLVGCSPSVRKIVSFRQYDTVIGVIVDSYLVESDGDLLIVLYCYCDRASDELYFQVFKLEFERELAKLVVLRSLGDKALLLSPWTIFSLTASKYPGCKANSIYSMYDDEWHLYDERCILKLCIYDFEKGSRVIINDDDASLYVDWGRCSWFTPNLLK